MMQHRGVHRCRWARSATGTAWVVSFVAAVAVLLWSAPGFAGEASAEVSGTSGWSLSAGAGVQELASYDEMGSPLVYHGWGVPLMLRADLRRQGWSAGGRIDAMVSGFNAPHLSASPTGTGGDTEDPTARAVFGDLSGWIQWPVASLAQHQISVGVGLGHWTFVRSYAYHPAQIGGVETWDAVVSADLRGGIKRQFDNWSWSVAASMSLGARMLRPSHSMRGDERIGLVDQPLRVLTYGGWATVNRLQMMQAEGALGWQLNSRWSLNGEYRVGYLSYRDDLTTRAFRQQVLVGATLHF